MTESARWTNEKYGGYHIREPLEDDVDLTRVGPTQPCGEYMRRFWTPVAMTEQLGERPVPIRILGEDLVGFRDLSGTIGLLHRPWSPRRTSLEYGRIEKPGMRCA